MEDNKKQKYIILVAALCILVLILTIFSEKSDLFNGVGSDGIFLDDFIPYLPHHITHKSYPSEAMSRFLPVLIGRAVFLLLNLFHPDQVQNLIIEKFEIDIHKNLILTFEILNLIYLCLSIIIFSYIFYKRNISFRGFSLCIALFVLNFMFLKQFFFEPVFLDQFYLLFSVLLLYSLLYKIKWLQYTLLFCSLFVSSVAAVFCLLLLFNDSDSNIRLKLSRNFILFLFTIAYLSVSLYLLKYPLCTEYIENKTIYSLSYISIGSALLYLWVILYIFIPRTFTVSLTKNPRFYLYVCLSIACYMMISHAISTSYSFEWCKGVKENLLNKIINNIRQVNSRPLGFLSSHFNYYGLLIIFMFLWGRSIKNFLEQTQRYVPLMLFFIFSSMTSESRYLTAFLPFVLLMLFDKFDEAHKLKIFLTNEWLIPLVVFNVIWSGFYIIINPLDTITYSNILSNNAGYDGMLSYPLQKYFKHLGPWTSNQSYLWQLSVFCVTLFCILICYKLYSYTNTKGDRIR